MISAGFPTLFILWFYYFYVFYLLSQYSISIKQILWNIINSGLFVLFSQYKKEIAVVNKMRTSLKIISIDTLLQILNQLPLHYSGTERNRVVQFQVLKYSLISNTFLWSIKNELWFREPENEGNPDQCILFKFLFCVICP